MTRTVALLFPGQASQEVGMGVSLREASERADGLFRLADEITGLPISELCASGPLSELTRTSVAQVAVVVTSLAAAEALDDALGGAPRVVAVAGHSVGELAAMCWAGALSLEQTLRLVHERGRLMERDALATDGTMVAVLGLDGSDLESICVEASASVSSSVQVANFNAPGQIVLSGHRLAIEEASRLALAAGADRVIPLKVGGPFHSAFMKAAARDFRAAASAEPISHPRVPIILNTTARPESEPAALRAELAEQILRPVLWDGSLQTLAELGCDTFVELGPGQVLTGLVKRTLPGATALAVGNPMRLTEAVRLLSDVDSDQIGDEESSHRPAWRHQNGDVRRGTSPRPTGTTG